MQLLPNLFRTEFRKIVAVLCKLFGLSNMQVAEDIVSDTFLLAAETWGMKGVPDNPTAWLYTVAKNKTRDYLRRHTLFTNKISGDIKYSSDASEEMQLDLSPENITDSQLQMIFAICHPSIPATAQIGLALRILCGLGIDEIADAFLSNKQTINKRLFRAKEKLREQQIEMVLPAEEELPTRIDNVVTTLYLLFNEGYYSASQNTSLRKDLCLEAMRLTYLLIENPRTNSPALNALLSLFCFHASRFDARQNEAGEIILYEEQDKSKWDDELIFRGEYFLNKAATGNTISKYHLEAAIAYWHTLKQPNPEKWENILQLYNQLLQIEYSPIIALNRTYALAKANGFKAAIKEAEKLDLKESHLYHTLLGELYKDIDHNKSLNHLQLALKKAKTDTDKSLIQKKISQL